MTSTTSDQAAALPGRPPMDDLASWQAARDELKVREQAHTAFTEFMGYTQPGYSVRAVAGPAGGDTATTTDHPAERD